MRLVAVLLAVVALGSKPSFNDWQQPVARTTTAGVVIDVSVLDRTGQPVVDLELADFELSEGGARQQILSATLVHAGVARAAARPSPPGGTADQPPAPSRADGLPGPGAPPPAPAVPENTPTVTAILFDRLSPEVRPLARRAALAYVSTLTPPHDYAGVFLADLTMRAASPFTSDPDRVRQGIDRIAAVAPTTLASSAGASSAVTRGLPVDPNQAPTAGAETASAGWVTAADREKALNAAPPEGPMRRMELRMAEGYTQFMSEYEGQSSLSGLRAVVHALGMMPGRKSILYFTESLPITDRLKPKFDALIGHANRVNITVYPVDAAGLRIHSRDAQVNRNVSVAAGQGLGDAKREGAWTKELEHQEQLLTSAAAAVLGRLAKETGGFLLENTNDLAAGVARMNRERTTYYLLAYQPTNTALDGKFRRVTVKVKRARVTVRSRPGYTAF